jgi:hypothetical protein
MSHRRVLRRAARAALLILAAVVPAAARAQPACTAGALADYLAPGFACRIGAWAFDEFDYFTFADASAGVSASVPDARLQDVRPFRRVGAGRRVEVGFTFLGGLGSIVSTTASDRGDEEGTAVAQIEFLARTRRRGARLLGVRTEHTASLDGTTPATTFLRSQSFAQVVDVFGPGTCLEAATLSPAEPGFVHDEHVGWCEGAPPHEVFTLLSSITRLDRDGDETPAPLFGITTATVQHVTFVTAQVVPEPATVALVATGLLGLTLAARSRRSPRRDAPRRSRRRRWAR